MEPKVVLITGASTGIGYETVKAFLRSKNSYHIFLGSRSAERGETALRQIQAECPATQNKVEMVQIDLESDESIQSTFEAIRDGPGHLDVLIHNAGAGFDLDFVQGNMSLRECFNKAYDVNVSGAQVLTWTMMPLLLQKEEAARSAARPPRILFVAGLSQMTQAAEHYFPTPPQPAGWPKRIDFETIGYRCSKTAMNMLMLDWDHKLRADGVKVFSVSPGFCATGLGGLSAEAWGAMGAGPPTEGAERLLAVAEGQRDADAGKVLDKVGFLPW
ncbi:hypothetical protein F4778DRAFT_43135 [Xylariomycetidae sp. FL2044]|nr:hypothetical protein F4778DRAFT_43135 [Xylariomycetidae sp. FL2044]